MNLKYLSVPGVVTISFFYQQITGHTIIVLRPPFITLLSMDVNA
jgi:hypothetical protein